MLARTSLHTVHIWKCVFAAFMDILMIDWHCTLWWIHMKSIQAVSIQIFNVSKQNGIFAYKSSHYLNNIKICSFAFTFAVILCWICIDTLSLYESISTATECCLHMISISAAFLSFSNDLMSLYDSTITIVKFHQYINQCLLHKCIHIQHLPRLIQRLHVKYTKMDCAWFFMFINDCFFVNDSHICLKWCFVYVKKHEKRKCERANIWVLIIGVYYFGIIASIVEF